MNQFDNAFEQKLLEGHSPEAAMLSMVPPAFENDPLLSRDDVLVTPHMGSATDETRERMAQLAAENLLAQIDGTLLTPVELPETAEATP